MIEPDFYREIAYHKERQRLNAFYTYYVKEYHRFEKRKDQQKATKNDKERQIIASGIIHCMMKLEELTEKYEEGRNESDNKVSFGDVGSQDSTKS